MRVLIGMECSGRVREAFRALGHDAWSCDYQPADDGSKYHIQGSVFDHEVVNGGWDLGIFHPDCTWATGAGARWMKIEYRKHLLTATVAICRAIMAFPMKKIVVENPIGRLSKLWMKPTQIVHPWWFGQKKLKPTCLWIKGMEKMVPTDLIKPPKVKDMTTQERRMWCEVWLASPGKDRGKRRSVTFQAVADQFAAQFGGITLERWMETAFIPSQGAVPMPRPLATLP